jgi:hypothetical protein
MFTVLAWYKWRICTQLRLVLPFLYPIAVSLQILNFHSRARTRFGRPLFFFTRKINK